MVYFIVSVLFLLFFWCLCMAINVSVQYNVGLLPDIMLLTQCYFHRGTRLNFMKRFCLGYSVLNAVLGPVAGLSCTRGVWYIYDWDTG